MSTTDAPVMEPVIDKEVPTKPGSGGKGKAAKKAPAKVRAEGKDKVKAPTAKAKAKAKASSGPTQRDYYAAAILLKQASDPTRLTILQTLAAAERNVGDMAADLGFTQPAISHHLALMRHAGLVVPRRDEKHIFYSVTDKGRGLAAVVASLLDRTSS